jgi:hypothetical protein
MYVKEIFEHLGQGELRNLAIGAPDDGGIARHDYAKVIPHINLGITEIYSRLGALYKKVNIQCDKEIQTYHLHPKYAQAGTAPTKYIMDSVEDPFLGNVLKIESIKDHTINDLADPLTISSDSYLQFMVPEPTDELLELQYKAQLPQVSVAEFDLATTEIDFPYTYVPALLNYIGSRVLVGMTTPKGELNSMGYMAKFEGSMTQLLQQGFEIVNDTTNTKLHMNGWV